MIKSLHRCTDAQGNRNRRTLTINKEKEKLEELVAINHADNDFILCIYTDAYKREMRYHEEHTEHTCWQNNNNQ